MQEVNDSRSSLQSDVCQGPSDDVFIFPASFAQQRLWFLDKLDPGQCAYNVPFAIHIEGDLDIDVLKRSICELIARHEILRTTFSEDETGKPIQVVAAKQNSALSVTNLRTIPSEAREDEARRRVIEDVRLPFDLKCGPLFRATLLSLGDNEYVLSFVLHHSVIDGWSRGILLRELFSMYEAFVEKRPSPLPDPALQYGDYATWQQDWLQGKRLEDLLGYWRQQLRGAPAMVEIPTDFPRPQQQTFIGAQESISVPQPLEDALMELSRKEGVTFFMTLLAAFNLLLARYSGQEDIVVGSPISGRTRSELEGLIGFFVNTLPLRTDVSGNPSFRELLARVRETTLQAYAHQDLPFERLVEDLKPERNLSRSPVVQVMFILENAPQRENRAISKMSVAPFRGAEGMSAKFDLTLTALVKKEGLRLGMTYNVDLFQPATVRRMLTHFHTLLEAIAADSNRPVAELPLLSTAERDELLIAFNATTQSYPHEWCVHQLFEQQVGRTPDAIAVTHAKTQLSYRDLDRRANQVARVLQKQGVRPETTVGICFDRSVDMLVGILGVLKAGAAYVPLDPAYPKDRIAFVIEDSKLQVLLTQRALRESLPHQAARVICIDSDWAAIAAEDEQNLFVKVGPQNLAYLLYTSGSTGKPKGVQVQHQSVVNFLASMRREPGFEAHDVLVAVTTLSFDIAGLELYLPLTVGGRVVIASREEASDGPQLLSLMGRSGVTVMQATPATWRLLLDSSWQGDPKLKILCGGEALPRELAERLLPRCRELWNMYGPTETTIWSSVHRVQDVTWNVAPIGRPIANTQMYVLDRYGQLAPMGVPGELVIGGDGVARGYWNRPELTAQKFIVDCFSRTSGARLYKTGDLVRYLPDRNIQYLDRLDNQVKIRGFRIELGEIESVLSQHSGVRHAVVVMREDSPGDKRVVAYLVVEGNPPSDEELRTYLKQGLPEYMIPAAFVTLSSLPLTPNGKVDRRALPPPDYSAGSSRVSVPPRNEDEELLVEIWKKVLGLSSIGVADNFFELGGHSLLAVRLMSEIQKVTGKLLPLATLFQGATIEYLAKLLKQDTKHPDQMVQEIQGGHANPPFFAIVTPGVNALGYVALARHLGPDQPLYRIQGPGRRLFERPYTAAEYEQMAANYIEAMKTVQPTGPYYVGGMCEGARIAFDMVRLLEARGEEIALLAIFDTWVIENNQNRFFWYLSYHGQRLHALSKLPRSQFLRAFRKSFHSLLKRLFKRDKQAPKLWREAYWPGKDFVAPKCNGKITVFRLARQPFYYVRDSLLGWGDRTTSGVELCIIRGKHNFVLREPYVQSLAKELRACLTRLHAIFANPAPTLFAGVAKQVSSPGPKFTPNIAPAGVGEVHSVLGTSERSMEVNYDSIGNGKLVLPMSVEQQRLWVLNELEHSSPAHNLPVCVELHGKLQRHVLDETLRVLFRRHRILRSCFVLRDGRPVCLDSCQDPVALEFVDLTDIPEAQAREKVRQLAQEEVLRPFVLERGPLLRPLLLKVTAENHLLLLVAHHIACDGKSVHILVAELAACYAALTERETPGLAEIVADYSDYVVWQQRQLQQGAFSDDVRYWKKQLTGASALELPIDYARPALQSFRGATQSFTISGELRSKLDALSRREHVSVSVTLSSVFIALLYRYTGQDDIMIGTEMPGRHHRDTANVVGVFSDYMALRVDVSGNPDFRELLRRLSAIWADAQRHRGLPFESLLEDLQLRRDLSRNPLFQVIFTQQAGLCDLSAAGLIFKPFPIDRGAGELDLSVRVLEYKDKLDVHFSYCSDLFNPTTIDRMIGHFRMLLEAAAANPESHLSELPLLTRAEQEQLLEWNNTAVDYPRDISLNRFIEQQVERTPGAVALGYESQELSYRELNSRANQLAHYLLKLGVGPDVLVGLCVERSVEMVVALLGTVKAGGAYVPLDPEYPIDRLESMLDDAKPAVVLMQAHLMKRLPKTSIQVICLDRDWHLLANESTENPQIQIAGTNLAYAIYTSGSTGKPKGVPNTHEGIVNRLLWMQDMYRLTPADRVLQKTPYSFDVSVWEFFWPLMTGARLVIARHGGHKDPVYLSKIIREQNITTVHFVPSMLGIFLDGDGVENCRSLRQVFASGEALPFELQQRFFERLKAELHNLYGPTEAAVDVTYFRCRPDTDRSIVPIGRPVANTQIYILDSQVRPVPVRVAGELHIGGRQLARGYLNRPDLTAEKFIRSPFSDDPQARLYKTGDLARYLPDGNIEYLGRIDHQVKLRGFRIELGEIESVLAEYSLVRQAVVTVREDVPGSGNKYLIAYLVLSGSQNVNINKVRDHAKAKLPEYMVPAKFMVLDKLPMTTSGKVDRKKLPAPEPERKARTQVVPRTELESLLASIYRRVLGTGSVGVTDDFFDLGGDSLMAARMLSEIYADTGKQIPLALLFRGATPEYLARVIEQDADLPPDPVAMMIQSGDSVPPFFAVVPPGENAVGYVKLARHIGPAKPFYKLQGPGAVLVDRPYTDQEMQALAEQYVDAMRSVQAEGPYYFGGLCDGAHIAVRMARKLDEDGQKIAMLAIFDTWVLENSQRHLLWLVHYYADRLRQFRKLPVRRRLQIVARTISNLTRLITRHSQDRGAWSKTYWPDKSFVPPRFSGRITLFKRPKQPYYYVNDPQMGWGRRAAGGIDMQVVPIEHEEMLREPHVEVLAKRLGECLQTYFERAEQQTENPIDNFAFSGTQSGAS